MGLLRTPSQSYACRAYRSAAFSPASGSYVLVPFDAETSDPYNMHDNVTNNTRITIVKSGLYSIKGLHRFGASGATNYRSVRLFKNGVNITTTDGAPVANGAVPVNDDLRLSVGDYIEMGVNQDSGGALASNVGEFSCYLSVARLGA